MRKLATTMKKRAAPTAGTPSHDDLCMLQNSRIPGEVKIGRSTAVEQRRAHLQCSQNFHMVAHAVFPGRGHLEDYVHKLLADKRVANVPGREWFRYAPKEAIDAVSAAIFGGS